MYYCKRKPVGTINGSPLTIDEDEWEITISTKDFSEIYSENVNTDGVWSVKIQITTVLI